MTFIAFEGGDAVGKSTQAARLANRLGAVLTREPGGTKVGEIVRDMLLHQPFHLTHKAEALLLAAARAEHVDKVVRPALAEGRTVISDRYIHSSLAYQGWGRGLPVDEVQRLSEWATSGLWPDLVVLIDVPDDVARSRLAALDNFESEDWSFRERIATGFRAMAAEDPDRWVVVDGTGTPDEVERLVWSAVSARLSA